MFVNEVIRIIPLFRVEPVIIAYLRALTVIGYPLPLPITTHII